ncbi:hypothetical protein J3Q64DRAFT_1709511 [Phycomyces blakesleeanus]|uniref:WWE domain-containing protein n=2 Tax=Phycomyces blakesleeanus TaxID=4837 RepID=A0A167KGE2_PHYB8|nr:hypothetical protein PHYBLDRAFT_173530 [Phycomyces blakesleeanus NRRL 1555(-)]OAD68036.1 hypothetical protein PHYBLDRAFT_173530 [Phycomyces blakesleeanus NRRL 1555(-)]|eukprot:XP_018286076.1 hypothetical protein PHYBLDRAFT_173530 [Phycomyces blakesleeanus NRRL 1555(-)]
MTATIRNHPYHFELTLQKSGDRTTPTTTSNSYHSSNNYFTWLVFMKAKWVPFDPSNQHKLEQTLSVGGTFIDINDSNFPSVRRVRVFPKSNYLSYLGVKYRLSRVMQPDVWGDRSDHTAFTSSTLQHTPHTISSPLASLSPLTPLLSSTISTDTWSDGFSEQQNQWHTPVPCTPY